MELKPCKCGNNVELEYFTFGKIKAWYILCDKCNTRKAAVVRILTPRGIEHTKEELIKDWNRSVTE